MDSVFFNRLTKYLKLKIRIIYLIIKSMWYQLSEKKREGEEPLKGTVKEGVIQYGEERIICSFCGEEIKSDKNLTECPYCNTPLGNGELNQ